jgi:hypothetical protein
MTHDVILGTPRHKISEVTMVEDSDSVFESFFSKRGPCCHCYPTRPGSAMVDAVPPFESSLLS